MLYDVLLRFHEVPSDKGPTLEDALSEAPTLVQKLRKQYGVTLLAIRRDIEILSNPKAETKIQANDILVVLAPIGKLAEMAPLLSTGQG